MHICPFPYRDTAHIPQKSLQHRSNGEEVAITIGAKTAPTQVDRSGKESLEFFQGITVGNTNSIALGETNDPCRVQNTNTFLHESGPRFFGHKCGDETSIDEIEGVIRKG